MAKQFLQDHTIAACYVLKAINILFKCVSLQKQHVLWLLFHVIFKKTA